MRHFLLNILVNLLFYLAVQESHHCLAIQVNLATHPTQQHPCRRGNQAGLSSLADLDSLGPHPPLELQLTPGVLK